MMKIFKCSKCGKFTLEETHCGTKTENPKPARYSPIDKYAKYRRMGRGRESSTGEGDVERVGNSKE